MKKKTKTMKGQMGLGTLITAGMSIVVLVIVLAVGSQVLDNIQTTQTNQSVAYNVTGQGLTGLSQFGNWITVIVLVIIAAVVIGILLNSFMRSGQGA